MTVESHQPWQKVGGSAAENYERALVPAMFAPWAATLVGLAGIHPGERLLDLACGTGVVARMAATKVGISGRVVGLDINGAMLAVARELPPVGGAAIEWVEASALDMPLVNGSFDVVLCQQGLQQFPDRPQALREIHRVLAPNGRLWTSVWGRIDGSPAMAALVDALGKHVGPQAANNRRAPFALGDADQLRDLLEDGGFREVRVQTLAKSVDFASPEAFVEAQLSATPLSTLGALTLETHRAIEQDVHAALHDYLQNDRLIVPMEAHIATARRGD